MLLPPKLAFLHLSLTCKASSNKLSLFPHSNPQNLHYKSPKQTLITTTPAQNTTTSTPKHFLMEFRGQNERAAKAREEKLPLLQDTPLPNDAQKNLIQQAITQTFQSTAHLANLLPTGTVLAFQLLSPIFSNQGQCDSVSRSMTAALIALCGISCFVLSFSDSFKDSKGNICYGFATLKGIWVVDGSATLPATEASKYRIQPLDFVHAILSVLVFVAIALFDGNVVHCFCPEPSVEAKELLSSLPVGIGALSSMLFVVFPTKRHGIGFPLTSN